MRSSPNASPSDVRASALWGAGSRKGELRSSALWGKGGRRVAGALLAVVALALPLAASGKDRKDAPQLAKYVSPGLLKKAQDNPTQNIRIIIQSDGGSQQADKALRGLGKLKKDLRLVGAVSVEVPAGVVNYLAGVPGLTITPDSPVKVSGSVHYSTQMWPYESGNAALWNGTTAAPTIAIVDSGLDATRADFTGRAYPQVNLSTLTPNATGDGRGHGTFVAGIAAGDAAGYTGAAPAAKILPIRVMDDNGVAMTSDVIRAAQWIYDNKGAYNIRVANFSLHSAMPSRFTNDPLDKAVEKLWFAGVTVVVAAGNYGTANGPSGVRYAPGNDPFVITVGAADLGGSIKPFDDAAAPWSAYGYTYDGFAKPEIGAPGRYMVGPVPTAATLTSERPDHVVAPGYMQLSGTSFAAPAVAGAVAQILSRHSSWTPDQIKGALMVTAKPVPGAIPLSLGVGELNAAKAAWRNLTPPNPNAALNRFVVSASNGSGMTFDAASWSDYVKANASWADASWSDASWADASWSAASWADASWADASWADGSLAAASWADAAIASASWADMSHEDAAEGDTTVGAVPLDAADQLALLADPELAVPATELPPSVPLAP
ncbi:MAG: serine protease AprX [Gaiellaceae bacterium]|jgi:serine protease AprX|nr:serine protease AprX [Gaiellaceae bacterium]